jgi:hypothetical protein
MRINFSPLLPILMSVGLCVLPTTASGEVRCSAEVSYRWIKAPEIPPTARGEQQGPVAPEKGKKAPPETPTPLPPTPTPDPIVVKMMGIERSAGDEVAAKAALQVEADKQRIKASELCKRDHESFGTCFATKLSNRASVLNSLSFKTRQEVETALSDECKRQQGTCLATEVSEPKCTQIGGATPPEQASEGDKKADTSKKPDTKKK